MASSRYETREPRTASPDQRQEFGTHPQPPWHSQVAFSPHSTPEPAIEHGVVQKCVVGSPRFEQNGAFELVQSLELWQYWPTPIELPMSPGVHDQDPSCSPDRKCIAYFADKTGEF